MYIDNCENCFWVDTVINNRVKKFDIITRENVSLHNALIQTRDMIIQLSNDTANLRDGIFGDPERNLQLYIQLQALALESDITKKHNLVSTECKIAKQLPETSTSAKQKEDFVPISKYNDLLNLINDQKITYQANLELLQSFSIKSNTKLKEEIDNIQQHMTKILEIVQQENLKYLQYAQNQIDTETVNKVIADNREAMKNLHDQIVQGDELMTKLCLQQKQIEANAANHENYYAKQQDELKNTVNDLKEQLQLAKDKFSLLDKSRPLDGEGFRNDIEAIHKDIKELQRQAEICKNDMEVNELQIEEVAILIKYIVFIFCITNLKCL